MNKIITIAREYGSAGRIIAKKVSERLGIQYYDNESKHTVWRKNKKENPLVTGFLNEALHQQFPLANTEIFLGKHRSNLNILVDTDQGLYVFNTSVKNIFKISYFFIIFLAVSSPFLVKVISPYAS